MVVVRHVRQLLQIEWYDLHQFYDDCPLLVVLWSHIWSPRHRRIMYVAVRGEHTGMACSRYNEKGGKKYVFQRSPVGVNIIRVTLTLIFAN